MTNPLRSRAPEPAPGEPTDNRAWVIGAVVAIATLAALLTFIGWQANSGDGATDPGGVVSDTTAGEADAGTAPAGPAGAAGPSEPGMGAEAPDAPGIDAPGIDAGTVDAEPAAPAAEETSEGDVPTAGSGVGADQGHSDPGTPEDLAGHSDPGDPGEVTG